jgi:cell division protein FtsB
MPGDLAEKIRLWSVLNRILKNNGFIDADQINADIATLKTNVNKLLNEILGVEHTVDNLDNYDDTPIKETIANLETKYKMKSMC